MKTLEETQYIPRHIARVVQQFATESKRLLQENVMAEYLFGSYATNRQTPASDIDILVLVKTFTPETRKQLSGMASEYSLEHDVYISPIVKDLQVWNANKAHNTLFYQEVMEHGVAL